MKCLHCVKSWNQILISTEWWNRGEADEGHPEFLATDLFSVLRLNLHMLWHCRRTMSGWEIIRCYIVSWRSLAGPVHKSPSLELGTRGHILLRVIEVEIQNWIQYAQYNIVCRFYFTCKFQSRYKTECFVMLTRVVEHSFQYFCLWGK